MTFKFFTSIWKFKTREILVLTLLSCNSTNVRYVRVHWTKQLELNNGLNFFYWIFTNQVTRHASRVKLFFFEKYFPGKTFYCKISENILTSQFFSHVISLKLLLLSQFERKKFREIAMCLFFFILCPLCVCFYFGNFSRWFSCDFFPSQLIWARCKTWHLRVNFPQSLYFWH
jgi:hypothetical protein